MQRRLFKTGNSVVLSLPKEMLDSLGVSEGEDVSLELDRQEKRLIITPVKKPLAIAGIDEDFAHQVNDFIEHYRAALEEMTKQSRSQQMRHHHPDADEQQDQTANNLHALAELFSQLRPGK